MIRARKWFVYLLSLVLLLSLVGTALATGFNHTLGKPQKVEVLLHQSNLYSHFVANATAQAKKTAGDANQSGTVSLSDTAVQSAAQSAFPPQLIEKNVNVFIDSNYAWLEGKTATPAFTIDLSSQKQTFAQKVGQYVKTYTAGLPVCTAADAAQLQQITDPLAATCRPPSVTPEAAGNQVTAQLSSSNDLLSNPVITAATINPKSTQQSQPYYVKLSHLPQLYRLGVKLPLLLGALSIICALGIISIEAERRKGVRRVGIVLFIAGIILVAIKLSSDSALTRLERRAFNNAGVGQLQQSLTDFAHRVELSLVKTDLIFGIGFLVLALIIFGVLLQTRPRKPKLPKLPDPNGTTPQPGTVAEPGANPSPKPKKPPRLIQ